MPKFRLRVSPNDKSIEYDVEGDFDEITNLTKEEIDKLNQTVSELSEVFDIIPKTSQSQPKKSLNEWFPK